MKSRRASDRGFVVVEHETYSNQRPLRLIQESSMIGEDEPDPQPGSSFLWIGQQHHLDREEVRELVARMDHWLQTGRLECDEE